MALSYPVENFALLGSRDKFSNYFLKVIEAAVSTGLYEICASGVGNGAGGAFQNRGQTAGLGGPQPFNVFTAGLTTGAFPGGAANSLNNTRAWFALRAITGGLTFVARRGTGSYGDWSFSYALGGVANTGATALVPPANVGTTVFTHGTSHADGGQTATAIATNVSSFSHGSANALWVNVCVESALQTLNVCPFWAWCVDRTAGVNVFGTYVNVLDRVSSTETFPAVVACRGFEQVFGTMGSASAGVFYATGCAFGGSALASMTFGRTGSFAYASGATIPGTSFAAARGDGTVVSPTVRASTSAGEIGTVRGWKVNPHNRNFPSTYNIGLDAFPARVTLGQVIVPWSKGVAPAWSP